MRGISEIGTNAKCRLRWIESAFRGNSEDFCSHRVFLGLTRSRSRALLLITSSAIYLKHAGASNPQLCNREVMPTPSPRDVVLGQIIALVSISFLLGIFFMQGVTNAVRGDWVAWLFFLSLPLLAFAIVVVSRRISREIR
jgi:hypothetical protein